MKDLLTYLRPKLLNSERILVVTDFDGTACSLAHSPRAVNVAPSMIEALRELVRIPRITVGVFSGRQLRDLTGLLPVNVLFAGNHGLDIRGCGLSFRHPGARILRSDLESLCEQVGRVVEKCPGAWLEDKELSATVHYRQVDVELRRVLLFAVRQKARSWAKWFRMQAGSQSVEFLPRIGWDKGAALAYVRHRLPSFDLTICLGDDPADESMFRANRGSVNVRVGPGRPTAANFHLSDPARVPGLFVEIARACAAHPPPARRDCFAVPSEVNAR